MKSIKIYNEEEQKIIDNLIHLLRKTHDSRDYMRLTDTLSAINRLAESIALYPSLLDPQLLGTHSRTLDTLVDNICQHRGLDLELNTPTRAILGRNFAIAKMNLFLLMSYLCRDFENLCEKHKHIKQIIYNYVFSLMAEDVFISIISDLDTKTEIRRHAARLLAGIWETRIYTGVQELSPMLIDLWMSRLAFNPSYGTMIGITEITKFCTMTNPAMIDFISGCEFNNDLLESLREYLMGLSYRELMKVRDFMRKNSLDSITSGGIEKILGGKRSYPVHDTDDPREIYHFYARRNDNAQYRSRSGIDGPKKTIEEYMVIYLIENSMITPDGPGEG